MVKKFSERMGFVDKEDVLYISDVSMSIRNRLYNFTVRILDNFYYKKQRVYIIKNLIDEFHKVVVDEFGPDILIYDNYKNFLMKFFRNSPFYELYDYIEYFHRIIIKNNPSIIKGNVVNGYKDIDFVIEFNCLMEEEKSAYRMVGGIIAPITDEIERNEVQSVLSESFPFSGAREHMRVALECFSKKPNPDYRNAIKEAISAVESVCKFVSKKEKATLSDALKVVGKIHGMHPAMVYSFNKLYGYASDEDGIRHALLNADSNVSEAEAHFMIVSCSAFVNYVANIWSSSRAKG